jgi:hypothetical protein
MGPVALTLGVIAVLAVQGHGRAVMGRQTIALPDRPGGEPTPVPSSDVMGASAPPHPVNEQVPRDGRVLMVADVGRVFYIRRAVTYHSAFDPAPLGSLLAKFDGDPRAVTRELRRTGHTHVWVGWSELKRLRRTYGYDPRVTPRRLQRLVERWRRVQDYGNAALYELPEADTARTGP